MSSKQAWSPAAQFLLAAKAARASSLGDREYAKFLHDVLMIAIRTRMKFDHHELDALNREMYFSRSVGVFNLDNERHYSLACWYESSFAIAYQVSHNLSPWKCPQVFADDYRMGDLGGYIEGIPGHSSCCGLPEGCGRDFAMRNQTKSCKPKVAPGLYVRLPEEQTLFRCTAIGADVIRLVPHQPEKSVRKRLSFTREQWAQMFPVMPR